MNRLCACLLRGCAVSAAAQPLPLAEAWAQARQASGQVRGAALHAQSRALRAQALDRAGWPTLSVGGFAGRLSTTLNVDASGLASALNQLGAGLHQVRQELAVLLALGFSVLGAWRWTARRP